MQTLRDYLKPLHAVTVYSDEEQIELLKACDEVHLTWGRGIKASSAPVPPDIMYLTVLGDGFIYYGTTMLGRFQPKNSVAWSDIKHLIDGSTPGFCY